MRIEGLWCFFITFYLYMLYTPVSQFSAVRTMLLLFLIFVFPLYFTKAQPVPTSIPTSDSAALKVVQQQILHSIGRQQYSEALVLAEQAKKRFSQHGKTHLLLAETYLAAKINSQSRIDSAGFKAQQAVARTLELLDTNEVMNQLSEFVFLFPNNSCTLNHNIGKLLYGLEIPFYAKTFLTTAITDCENDSIGVESRLLLAQVLLNTTWQQGIEPHPVHTPALLPSSAKTYLLTALQLVNEAIQMHTSTTANTLPYGLLGDIYSELAQMSEDSLKIQYAQKASSFWRAAAITVINRKFARGFKDDEPSAYKPSLEWQRFSDFEIKGKSPDIDVAALARRIEYPQAALTGSKVISGRVMVMAYVNRYGEVVATVVYTKNAEVFEESIHKALTAVRYPPSLEGKMPVSCLVTIPFVFRFR